jgi:hypothetical protein
MCVATSWVSSLWNQTLQSMKGGFLLVKAQTAIAETLHGNVINGCPDEVRIDQDVSRPR